jgi:anti-anti-sigma regulatory factor
MNPPTVGHLSVWVGEHAACVRVTGRANFALSVDFRKLLQHLQAAGHPRVALELSECQLMDSTFLGVLAHEAGQRATRRGATSEPGLELWNPGERVRELISDLGIAHLFKITTHETAAAEFAPAPTTPGASREELTRTCLEAHELLMALNPANIPKFKDVARYFAEELKRPAP